MAEKIESNGLNHKVVLVHGDMGSRDSGGAVLAEKLREKNICTDEIRLTPYYSFNDKVEELKDIFKEKRLVPERTTVLGVDIGGTIALSTVLKHEIDMRQVLMVSSPVENKFLPDKKFGKEFRTSFKHFGKIYPEKVEELDSLFKQKGLDKFEHVPTDFNPDDIEAVSENIFSHIENGLSKLN